MQYDWESDDDDCDFCVFETVFLDNLSENSEVHLVVEVLVSIKKQHKCSVFPKFVPNRPKISDQSTLPRIPFLKFDQIVQLRFYQLCCPVFQKKLWNCSRKSANLGAKPKTFVVLSAHHVIWKKLPVWNVKNEVFSLRERTTIEYFGADDFKNAARFLEFNQKDLSVFHSKIAMDDLKILCSPATITAYFDETTCDFGTVLQLMPNLESLEFFGNLENWERQLSKSKQKFDSCHFRPEKVTDFKSLANFLRRQRRNFVFYLSNVELNEKKALKYFQLCPPNWSFQLPSLQVIQIKNGGSTTKTFTLKSNRVSFFK